MSLTYIQFPSLYRTFIIDKPFSLCLTLNKYHSPNHGITRIGYIGRIVPFKGVHVLLNAFEKLEGPAELHIYGRLDEDLVYASERQKKANQDAQIKFKGAYSHHELGSVLSEIDVLVVPSIVHETFCLTVREGLIAGVPVIASNIGGIPDAIDHGRNGFLFQPGNAGELTFHLQAIMNQPQLLAQLRAGMIPVKTVKQEVEELVWSYKELLTSSYS